MRKTECKTHGRPVSLQKMLPLELLTPQKTSPTVLAHKAANQKGET